MFYLFLFFNLLSSLFVGDKTFNSAPYVPYYNLTEHYENIFNIGPQLYSGNDLFKIENGMSLRNNEASLILDWRKSLCLKWFEKIAYVNNNSEVIYLGSLVLSKKHIYHFIFVHVSDNAQYIFVLSQFKDVLKTVILGEQKLEFPMSGNIISNIRSISSHNCIIELSSKSYDTIEDPIENDLDTSFFKLTIKKGTVINGRYKSGSKRRSR